jgi:methylglutaconyl-CoA hydratase
MYQHINLTAIGPIAYLTLSRAEQKNALNYVFIDELKQSFRSLESNEEIKVIILKSDQTVFCSGMDLGYLYKLQQYGVEENLYDLAQFQELLLQMLQSSKIIIAQVEGEAVSSGCGLVLASDFVFASTSARFAFRDIKYGFVPAMVATLLVRKVAGNCARELLLLGEWVNAERARELGLVFKVTEPELLENEIAQFIEKLLAENSTGAMHLTKRLIVDLAELPLVEAFNFASKIAARARISDEAKFGTECFLTKQPYRW